MEGVMAKFKHLPGRTEDNCEKPQYSQSLGQNVNQNLPIKKVCSSLVLQFVTYNVFHVNMTIFRHICKTVKSDH